MWNAATGEEIAALPGTQSKMRRVRFIDGGKRLLACGSQHEVLVYDVQRRLLAFTLPTETEVSDVILLPDAQTLALSLYGGKVALWDLDSRQQLMDYAGHRGQEKSYVFSLATSPDGSLVVSSGGDGQAKLWPTSRAMAAPPIAPTVSVRVDDKESFSVSFSPHGKLLATGNKDRTIRVRDAKTLDLIRTIAGHNGLVACVAFAPDGKWLASASSDGSARLWDPLTGKQLASWRCHGAKLSMVRSLAVSHDGTLLAAGNWDGETYVWDVTSQKLARRLPRQPLPVTDIAFSPDDQHLATSTGSWREPKTMGAVKVWDVKAGREVVDFSNPAGEVRSISFSPSGTHLLSIGERSTARIFDVEKRREIMAHQHDASLRTGAFLTDQMILLSDQAGKMRCWQWQSGVQTASFAGSPATVSGLAVSPGGEIAATVDLTGFAHLWPLEQSASEEGAGVSLDAAPTTAERVQSWRFPGVAAKP